MNLIQPAIFSKVSGITAAFTEANRSSKSGNGGIQGLDFGLNTSTVKSKLDRNYGQLLKDLEINTDSIALANQVHGAGIEIVDKPGVYENTDGLITLTSGLSLGIQVADCAAVLIADEKNRVIGAFHAGWRGAVAGIIPKGVKEMKSLGGEVKSFKAYISPCISKEMFEVGEEVAVQFPDAFVDRSGNAKPNVDLKRLLVHQMVASGMESHLIDVSEGCTMQDERFFSYRREHDKAGRMLGLIIINQD